MATEAVIEKSHVEWSPVFAGALAAAALSSVLLAAGASLGLSLISAYPDQSHARSAGTLAAAWSLIVTIGSKKPLRTNLGLASSLCSSRCTFLLGSTVHPAKSNG